jgi:AcrR family transcriptional regulator
MQSPFPEANLSNPTVVRILMSAGDAFAEHGYQGATTKQIAARAGVSKSLLHYHFQSKEHLLFELQSMLFRNVAASIRRMTLRGTPSIDLAIAAVDKVWRMMVGVEHYIPLVMDLWKLAATQPELREQQKILEAECRQLLVDGVHQTLGALVDRLVIPPERVAQLLMATLGGFAVHLVTAPDHAEQAFEDFKLLLRNLITQERTDG